MIRRLSLFIVTVAIASIGCRKKAEMLSDEKAITTFAFKASENVGVLTSDVLGVIAGDTIKVTVGALSVSKLVASVTFSGKTVSPSLDSSINFMEPVVYTVTANDGSIKQYTVIVNTLSTLYAVGQINSLYGSDNPLYSFLYALDAVTGKVKWRYALHTYEATNPTVANGIIYVGVLTDLLALDAATGELKWTGGIGPRSNTNPQVADKIVHIFSGGEGVSM